MSETVSKKYHLPNRFQRWIGNACLRVAPYVPEGLARVYLRRQKFYQTFLDTDPESTQGASRKKWDVIRSGIDVKGGSLLDIGCAEGFFCLAALRDGAAEATGVESEFRTLLSAQFLAGLEELRPRYRMGIFPDTTSGKTYDYVLCLSVLHHFFEHDMWSVLSEPENGGQLACLRHLLLCLRGLVSSCGACAVEIPYEYAAGTDRLDVDFERFSGELVKAGFASARLLGTWDSAQRNMSRKDRMIYVATA